jgi:UV DNA damage repair endonuclease
MILISGDRKHLTLGPEINRNTLRVAQLANVKKALQELLAQFGLLFNEFQHATSGRKRTEEEEMEAIYLLQNSKVFQALYEMNQNETSRTIDYLNKLDVELVRLEKKNLTLMAKAKKPKQFTKIIKSNSQRDPKGTVTKSEAKLPPSKS